MVELNSSLDVELVFISNAPVRSTDIIKIIIEMEAEVRYFILSFF